MKMKYGNSQSEKPSLDFSWELLKTVATAVSGCALAVSRAMCCQFGCCCSCELKTNFKHESVRAVCQKAIEMSSAPLYTMGVQITDEQYQNRLDFLCI